MEYQTEAVRNGDGVPISWTCTVVADDGSFGGAGPTENAAVLDAMARAAGESEEARMELGVLLGLRGDGKPGRPPLTAEGDGC